MVFSTPCFTKQRRLLLKAPAALLCAGLLPEAARASPAELASLQVERSDGQWLLTAQVNFQLSDTVRNALQKGIPMHFVAEAVLRRERWYWRDKTEATARRYMRVAYQPLTGRWRLNVSSQPWQDSGAGTGLTLNYDSLAEVQASVQRIARWPVAAAPQGATEERYWLQFRYWLDLSQLPPALQLGARGQPEWAIDVQRRLNLSAGGGT